MTSPPEPRLASRLLWFVLLWISGVAALSAAAWLIRWWLHPG